jgi:hypothetical protein
MPLKGALLGALEILPPAERAMRDVDVLVQGISLGDAVAGLGRAGFQIRDIPWSHGYVSLSHPEHETLWVDLHSVAMPLGFGRLTRAYLFRDAARDEALFGVPVFVPTRLKLAVHLIANIVKDRIVYAYPHAATDLAATVSAGVDLERLRDELRMLSLSQGAATAVTWAYRHTMSPELATLLDLLWPGAEAQALLLQRTQALVRSDQDDFWSRLKGRTGADNIGWRAAAPLLGAVSVLTWPVRSRWLRARSGGR